MREEHRFLPRQHPQVVQVMRSSLPGQIPFSTRPAAALRSWRWLGLLLACLGGLVQGHQTLVLSTSEGSPIQDISAEVLSEAYLKLGYALSIRRVPNIRSLWLANSGQVDGEVSRIAGMEDEHDQLIRVPVGINRVEVAAFSKNGAPEIQRWEDLAGLQLVCVKGSRVVEKHLALHKLPCQAVTHFPQSILMLQKGRVQVAVIPKVNGLAAIKSLGARGIVMSDRILAREPLYHYLHRKHAAVVPRLSEVLQEMEQSGRIEAIHNAYLERLGER
jgi:polar amino acid transport system substrate-binding protein